MITAERVRQLLNYDPTTGVLTWRVPRQGVKPSKIAGSRRANGYVGISIDGRNYFAHRIVWLYTYGQLPGAVIDHINGDKADNRLCNLREATYSLNGVNRYRQPPKSGLRGVKRHKNKWQAEIRVNGTRKHLGTFETKEAAYEAYKAAAICNFGDFVHNSVVQVGPVPVPAFKTE